MFELDKQSVWLKLLTIPLSGIFAIAIGLRALLYFLHLLPQRRLAVPVISVGNITVGGTGKSPVVIALASALQERGKRPGILTRGYGRKSKRSDALVLLNGKVLHTNSVALLPGDEAMMESVHLPTVPVVQCPSRYLGGKFAEHCGVTVDVWLLDDGFQHWGLHRDYDVLLIDGDDLGPQLLLPAGRLREPKNAAARADFVLFSRTDASSRWAVRSGQAKGVATFVTGWPQSPDGRLLPRGSHVALVSGVARPQRLKKALLELGVSVQVEAFVSDHAELVLPDVPLPIVTTAKDYYRNPSIFSNSQVYVTPLAVELPESLMFEIFQKVFRQPAGI